MSMKKKINDPHSKGIYFYKRTNKWQLQIEGKHCGYFETKELAEQMRATILSKMGIEPPVEEPEEFTTIEEDDYINRDFEKLFAEQMCGVQPGEITTDVSHGSRIFATQK